MSDIALAVSYSAEHQKLITRKIDDLNFSYRSWQDPELEGVRSAIRNHYRRQQEGRCAYCKNQISLNGPGNARVEHIVPKSKRPDFLFEPKNLCVICEDCNSLKRNQETLNQDANTLKNSLAKKYPRSSGAFLIVHPHFDRWEDHIVQFRSIYVDKTPKGHFTIGACVLNRRLREFGWEGEFFEEQALTEVMQSYLSERNPVMKARLISTLQKLLVTI